MCVATGADIAIDIAVGLAALGLLYAFLRSTGGREEAGARMELIAGVAVAGGHLPQPRCDRELAPGRGALPEPPFLPRGA